MRRGGAVAGTTIRGIDSADGVLFLALHKLPDLSVFQSILPPNLVKQLFLFHVDVPIHLREGEQVFDVVLFVGKILVFKKTEHIRCC